MMKALFASYNRNMNSFIIEWTLFTTNSRQPSKIATLPLNLSWEPFLPFS